MSEPTYTAQLNAALQWWQDAGVDCDFLDDATDWLAQSTKDQAAKDQTDGQTSQSGNQNNQAGNLQNRTNAGVSDRSRIEKVERLDLLGDSPPQSLEEFRDWWMEAPGLDAIGPRGRIPPRGSVKPKLMVLVVDPEAEDKSQLLSGPQGALLANMLDAMEIAPEETYFASALPRHTPMADTHRIAQSGMDRVTQHHIRLVSPQKLIAFGADLLPLFGENVAKFEQSLREINQAPSNEAFMKSKSLDSLLSMPRLKAQFWRSWIEWTSQ